MLHLRPVRMGLWTECNMHSIFGWVPYVVQDLWADILEDEKFLDEFILENRKVLAKHFTILRTFLEQHRIPYYSNV
jgi:hypothetical protein